MIWLGNFWYFGKVVAEERCSSLTVLKEQQQQQLTCTIQKILPSIFHYCEILLIENIKYTARTKTSENSKLSLLFAWDTEIHDSCLVYKDLILATHQVSWFEVKKRNLKPLCEKGAEHETQTSTSTSKNIKTIHINMITNSCAGLSCVWTLLVSEVNIYLHNIIKVNSTN